MPTDSSIASNDCCWLQGVNESLIMTDIDYKLGLWALEPPSYWTPVRHRRGFINPCITLVVFPLLDPAGRCGEA